MSEAARKARAEYMRKYRAEHKEKINEQERARRKANPDRYRMYQENYWNKKAAAVREGATG